MKELRDAEFFEDVGGKSEVAEQLRSVARNDQRQYRLIRRKIELLQRQELDDAKRSGLVKQPSKHIYVLRVQCGAFAAFRLPFFLGTCGPVPTMVFTHCLKRASLARRNAYSRLIAAAEERRNEWLERHCKEK